MKTVALLDAHAHLDFSPDPAGLAAGLDRAGVGALSMTVTPEGFLRAREALAASPNVMVGAGLHPWWVDSERDVEALLELMGQTRVVGEVGLDGTRRHARTLEAQAACLRRVLAAVRPSQLVSLHSAGAAGAVLDLLEDTGAHRRAACVMHWFSGSSPELVRAIRMGLWFSVGERMLATRRGREYARQIPAGRLLLETDLPDQDGDADAERLLGSLGRARGQLRGVADHNLLLGG